MAMAASTGLAAGEASDMSVALTALSGDMASFYNISQSMADTALKSVFTGETEVMKKYGVMMTQVNLEEFALAQGIKKEIHRNGASRKDNAPVFVCSRKVITGARAILQGRAIHGRIQTKILSEQFTVLKTELGQGLIQVLTPLLGVINNIIQSLIKAAKSFNQFTAALFGKQEAAVSESGETATDTAEAYDDLGEAIKGEEYVAFGRRKIDEINKMSDGNLSGSVMDGIAESFKSKSRERVADNR